MSIVMSDFLRRFRGREMNFAECLRALPEGEVEVGAIHEALLEAVDAGHLVRTGSQRYRLTRSGAAVANWASPPASGTDRTAATSPVATVLKVHPEDSPVVIGQRFFRELIFATHNTNAAPLSLERVTLRTGEESTPHAHLGTHTAIYTLSGTVRVYYGSELEHATEVGPDDCVYIPPGVIHHVVNERPEPMMAVVARSAARHEVVEYPHLRDRVHAVALS